ncbi:hypothetical protein Pcinc_034325 [Petrolisthes cinctipes]|uniref:Uncharacterized protein n=1 Tax=Petrolisthes cinctipes TaxID=88211 RepID=A0AAE1EQH5_PETCI|nr:hypothetical protein Pcinc_034325 [Petrolisthes cinctipes]
MRLTFIMKIPSRSKASWLLLCYGLPKVLKIIIINSPQMFRVNIIKLFPHRCENFQHRCRRVMEVPGDETETFTLIASPLVRKYIASSGQAILGNGSQCVFSLSSQATHPPHTHPPTHFRTSAIYPYDLTSTIHTTPRQATPLHVKPPTPRQATHTTVGGKEEIDVEKGGKKEIDVEKGRGRGKEGGKKDIDVEKGGEEVIDVEKGREEGRRDGRMR